MAMMSLTDKIRRIYEALDRVTDLDVSEGRPTVTFTADSVTVWVGPPPGTDENPATANIAHSLVSNIASIKDYLNAWCKANGKPEDGDKIINSNKRTVAIIHDLWNIDKHVTLKNPPRSGCFPRIVRLTQALSFSSGPMQVAPYPQLDSRTGQYKFVRPEGVNNAALVVDGDVEDENGVVLGNFTKICEEAIAVWEGAVTRLGIVLPPRA